MSQLSCNTTRILSGNELIVQGALEAGFSLLTGYPGSPLADYFNILHQRSEQLRSRGIRVAIGNSETNAAAMAAGAKQAGRDALMAVKSMGLHVAADALAVGNFSNHKMPVVDGEDEYAAVVVVAGDDPWSISTSMAADSRYLFKHLHIPFLEPATPQELKDWIGVARTLSRRSSVYQGVLVNTELAEGGGRVDVGEEVSPSAAPQRFDPDAVDLNQLMVPPNSLAADVAMTQARFPRLLEALAELRLDRQEGNPGAEIGLLAAGPVYETLKQVLQDLGLEQAFALYKPAGSYPLVDELLLPFIRARKALIVVEAKRGFLEAELAQLCQRNGLSLPIQGKRFVCGDQSEAGFPADGGLSYERIRDGLCRLLDRMGRAQVNSQEMAFPVRQPIPRLPTFCPGCPHRETLSTLKQLRQQMPGGQFITHGDVGCYSLAFLEPFREMHSLSAMGQGGANGAGIDLFSSNHSVVLMGDSTFFHSGINAISNSVQLGHDITYILLKNDCTAMTGHQMVPNSGQSIERSERPAQDMLQLVRGLGVEQAHAIHPSDREGYLQQLSELLDKPGTKVIVAEKECGLTYYGRQRADDARRFRAGDSKPKHHFYRINSAACEDCRSCVEMTGCPGLTRTEDAYGSKVRIDPQICVADGYCSKIEACPSFERIEISDYRPNKTAFKPLAWDLLPEPRQTIDLEALRKRGAWRVVVTGVGGSGVTTITRVLAEAAADAAFDQLDFRFFDQKGMAQRNGRVTSHLALIGKASASGPITPIGQADLLLSSDLLDATQNTHFLNSSGHAVVDQEFQTPLSMLLERGAGDAYTPASDLSQQLRATLGERLSLAASKQLCEAHLGKRVYAAAAILGVAYQQGLLPFKEQQLRGAFQSALPAHELDANWHAFQLGRAWIEGLHELPVSAANGQSDLAYLRDSLVDSLPPWHVPTRLLRAFDGATTQLALSFPEISPETLGHFIHDLLVFDRGRGLQEYLGQAGQIATRVHAASLRLRALRQLTRSHWIKDEMMVSHLLVMPSRQRDADLGEYSYSSRRVIHFNRLQFSLFGQSGSLSLRSPEWLLRQLRHWRWLRGLPGWHSQDFAIARLCRERLLDALEQQDEQRLEQVLTELESIKGYDAVRHQRAGRLLGQGEQRAVAAEVGAPHPV